MKAPIHSLPDALLAGRILDNLPAQDKLLTVPLVCKRWRALSQDALFWHCIDLYNWGDSDQRLVELLVTKSGNHLREFQARGISEDTLRFIAQRGGQTLQRLRISNCNDLPDKCISEVAPMLPFITNLDIFFCPRISEEGIEAFGRHCKSLTHFHVHVRSYKECMAIAEHMQQLEYLDVYQPDYTFLEDGLLKILGSCTNLKAFNFIGWRLRDDSIFWDFGGCQQLAVPTMELGRNLCLKIRIFDEKSRAHAFEILKEACGT